MVSEGARYQVEERVRLMLELPSCGECGTLERHTADIKLGRIPVDSFAALAREHEARWPGSVIEGTMTGYRIIGRHACNCRRGGEKGTA